MDDKELDALLAELRGEPRTLRARLTDYQGITEPPEESPEKLPEKSSEDESPEKLPEEPAPAKSARRISVRTRDALVGVFLTVFAVIGLIASVRYCAGRISRFRTAHAQETAVEACLLPLVLMDIADFDSPDSLSDEAFLTAAIWSMAASGALTDYPEHYGMCTVPQSDVIAAGNALFAGNRTPVCKTIGFTGDLRFYYDAEQSAYVLPQNPVLFTYIPSVTALTETDGSYTASVDYYEEQPHWKQNPQRVPVKTVLYTLRKTETGWQVLSAKQTDGTQNDV